MSAQGINKIVAIKKESAWGVVASGAGAQCLPRESATFDLEKAAFASNEINPSQQLRDSRHGTRKATGSLSGELEGGAFELLIAAALRRDFAAGATTGAQAVFAVTGTGTAFTRSTGSFISNGFKQGDVVAASGFTAANNNGHKVLITSVQALVMSFAPIDGVVLTDEAEGDTVTISVSGKQTYTPASGQTDDSFTVEEWYPDETISRVTFGQQVNSMSINAAPDSMVKVSFEFMGKDALAPGGTQRFTSPLGVVSQGKLSSADGILVVNGMTACRLTSFDATVSNSIAQEPGVACRGIIAKARGKLLGSGSLTVVLDSDEYLEYFDEEAEITASIAWANADDDVFALHFPRLKINSSTTDDGEKVILVTCSFEALEAFRGEPGVPQTTVVITDTSLS